MILQVDRGEIQKEVDQLSEKLMKWSTQFNADEFNLVVNHKKVL